MLSFYLSVFPGSCRAICIRRVGLLSSDRNDGIRRVGLLSSDRNDGIHCVPLLSSDQNDGIHRVPLLSSDRNDSIRRVGLLRSDRNDGVCRVGLLSSDRNDGIRRVGPLRAKSKFRRLSHSSSWLAPFRRGVVLVGIQKPLRWLWTVWRRSLDSFSFPVVCFCPWGSRLGQCMLSA